MKECSIWGREQIDDKNMNRLALLSLLALASCATDYQPQSLTGGFSDYMTAPDEAIVMFHANGYTSMERVIGMIALRCAEVTLAHGYRYFVEPVWPI
jgi:hypothetical protein